MKHGIEPLMPELAFELDLWKGNGCVAGHGFALECDAGFGIEEMDAGRIDAETDAIARSELRALGLDDRARRTALHILITRNAA